MDLASVVAALASVGVRVSGSTPNSTVQVDSSRACPTGLAGPEPSGTINDPGQHFQTVTEDMDPADAERYVFKRFRYPLPEVLQDLYFMATKEGKIKTLKKAKKWLNEQEQVDAPQVAAKRWKAIKLQHDGREIRLRDWRDFRGQYILFVEDWNEGDEQARLLSVI